MSRYTYLAADLRTNAVLAELPLEGVSFGSVLNGIGSLSGRLLLSDAKVRKIGPIAATAPGRTALYVDRDGVLVWGGIVWTRKWDSKSGRLAIGAKEFLSYFDEHRREATGAVYDDVDQLAIVRDLVTRAQAKPGGSIGIVVGTETSGVLRDRTYASYELKPLFEAVKQLAEVEGGFDFAVDVAWVGGVPTKTLVLSYPRRGRIAGATGHVFDLPGNIVEYEWPEDGTKMANTGYGVGSGEGDDMLRSSYSRTDLIDAGYPLLERVSTYKDVSVPATLDAHTRADVDAVAEPVTLPTITVRADHDPVLGSYIVGDDCRVRIDDDRHDGLDEYRRIVAVNVKPPAKKAESVTLTLGAAA